MSEQFDDMTRILASPISRRQAVKLIIGAITGAALAPIWRKRAKPILAHSSSATCPPGPGTVRGEGTAFGLSCFDDVARREAEDEAFQDFLSKAEAACNTEYNCTPVLDPRSIKHGVDCTPCCFFEAFFSANVTECTPASTGATLIVFNAVREAGGVILTWRTTAEVRIAGFNLYRAAIPSLYTRINDALIPAQGIAGSGTSYHFVDTTDLDTHSYELESVDYDDVHTKLGQVELQTGSYKIYLPLVDMN